DAAMSYSIYLALAAATAGQHNLPEGPAGAAEDLADDLQPALRRIRDLVEHSRQGPVTPLATAQFEKGLLLATRELGRRAAGWAYKHLEPEDVQALPAEVHYQGSTYRRLGKKTPQELSPSGPALAPGPCKTVSPRWRRSGSCRCHPPLAGKPEVGDVR